MSSYFHLKVNILLTSAPKYIIPDVVNDTFIYIHIYINSFRRKEENAMIIDRERIDTILAEQGITKAVLAERCGISRQNISTITRRGTCEPRTAGKLAAGLNVPVSEIIRQ